MDIKNKLINKKRIFVHWYKDRDFPEIKSGNDDVVGVVTDKDQLDRIIESHNTLVDYIEFLESEIKRLKDRRK